MGEVFSDLMKIGPISLYNRRHQVSLPTIGLDINAFRPGKYDYRKVKGYFIL